MAQDTHDLRLQLAESAYSDLALIAQHAADLPRIKDALSKVDPAATLKTLAERLSSLCGIQPKELGGILNGLVNLASVIVRHQTTAEQLFETISRELERSSSQSWKEHYLDKWKSADTEIIFAMKWAGGDEALIVPSKLRALTFAHQNILTGIRLIDDLRPIYNKKGDKILHFLLAYSLVIEFSDGTPRKIELALDASDLDELKRLCDRAQYKTTAAKEAAKSLSLEITVP